MQCLGKKTKGNLADQNFNPNCTKLYVIFSRNCKTWLYSYSRISIQSLSLKFQDGERFLSQKTQNTFLSLSLSRLSVFYFLSSKFCDSFLENNQVPLHQEASVITQRLSTWEMTPVFHGEVWYSGKTGKSFIRSSS